MGRSGMSESFGGQQEFHLAAELARPVPELEGYPEDAKDVLVILCNLWKMTPPLGHGKKLWIQSARLLKEACGEFTVVEVLAEEFTAWNNALHRGRGYSVVGPTSLINMARARVAFFRQRGRRPAGAGSAIQWGDVWDHVESLLLHNASAEEAEGALDPLAATAVRHAGGWDRLRELPRELARVKLEGEFRALTD